MRLLECIGFYPVRWAVRLRVMCGRNDRVRVVEAGGLVSRTVCRVDRLGRWELKVVCVGAGECKPWGNIHSVYTAFSSLFPWDCVGSSAVVSEFANTRQV